MSKFNPLTNKKNTFEEVSTEDKESSNLNETKHHQSAIQLHTATSNNQLPVVDPIKELKSPAANKSESDKSRFPSSSSASDFRRTLFVAGNKTRIQTAEGVESVDCVSNNVILGHRNIKILEVFSQYSLGSNVSLLHSSSTDLTRKLLSLVPQPLNSCFLVNSRSEANDLALSLALASTGSEEVIHLERADHGTSLTCMRMCRGNKHFHAVPVPDTFRGKFRDTNFPLEDLGWMYAAEVKELCSRLTKENKKPGVFISESVLTQAGYVAIPARYLHEVYQCIRSHGGIVIADETNSGLGRCGNGLWGFQDHDVVPDVMTIGKGLGNGYPISAVITSKDIAKKITTFVSYHKFLGDPLSCNIGLAVLDQLEDRTVFDNARKVGKYLTKNMKKLMDMFDSVGDVRSKGMKFGVDVVHSFSRDPNPLLAQFIRHKMFERKVVVELCGFQRNVIAFSPPFCLTMSEANQICSYLIESFNEAEKKFGNVKRKEQDVDSDKHPVSRKQLKR